VRASPSPVALSCTTLSLLQTAVAPSSSRSDPPPSHGMLVDNDHFTVVPGLAAVADTPCIVTYGSPLHLEIFAEALLREPFPPVHYSNHSPSRGRQGPSPHFFPSPLLYHRLFSLAPPSPPIDQHQRSPDQCSWIAIRFFPSCAPLFPTILISSSNLLSPRPHRRRCAARCPSIHMAWSCHVARVKFIGAARDLSTLVLD
jgi:hypothetical protein